MSNNRMSGSSSSSTSSFDSEEETDLQDLKPIKGYLSNRRELARQLFKSVKGEKIRMMLPQILKNMNLNELEEWCASELCGMSEARILCILNGQTMLHSSDTSETDDSGPSLEIISDTEEWLTDTDLPIKEEPSSSRSSKWKRSKRAKSKLQKRTEVQEKVKARNKKGNTTVSTEANVKVKQEKEKENRTNKEGESLLDLLELEMRARAIRALIRKEEGPSEEAEKRQGATMTTTALRNTFNSAISASFSDKKDIDASVLNGDMENKDKSEENSRSTLQNGEDEEDVVFVVAKTTPTIELLSSDGENEKETEKAKKKSDEKDTSSSSKKHSSSNKNDSVPEALSRPDTANNERIVTIDKSTDKSENLKIVITKRVSECSSSPKTSKTRKMAGEKGDKRLKAATSEKDKNSEKGNEPESGKSLFKKIRRKEHLRIKNNKTAKEATSEDPKGEESTVNCSVENSVSVPEEKTTVVEPSEQVRPLDTPIKLEAPDNLDKYAEEIKNQVELKQTRAARVSSDDYRLDDFEEIIDLDDYPDDMDEIESTEQIKKIGELEENKTSETANESALPAKQASQSAETWATRYYQTDDVQNVIKDSKIQSEIRKRLRERQRMSKLNSSPKLNSPKDSSSTPDKLEEKNEAKPTGSVQEYLALKNSSLPNTEETTSETMVSEDSPKIVNSNDNSSIVNEGSTDPS